MEKFRFESKNLERNIQQIVIYGYFSYTARTQINQEIQVLLNDSVKKFIFDFSHCELLSSIGVAAMLDLVCIIQEDYDGDCVLVGLDPTQRDFVEVTGINSMVETVDSIEEALNLL